MSILEINDIHKGFRSGFWGKKNPVLAGLSLTLQPGEVYGFLGHNGAGKSTAMKLILGLLRPDSGQVRVFDGQLVTPDTRRRIGYLSEEIGLYPHLNAAEMLRLVGELFRIRGKRLEAKTDELLEATGLIARREVKIRHYSKGMRQRLGVAAALMNDPDLLILDEPYSGLDPVGRRDLRQLLISLKERGKTIMLSSHIVPDVEAVCDRVGILRDGKVARILDLHEVYAERTNDVEVVISGVGADRVHARDYGGDEVMRNENICTIRCAGDNTLKTLVSDVYDAGGTVVGVRQVRLNLEEIFVEELSRGAEVDASHDRISPTKLVANESR